LKGGKLLIEQNYKACQNKYVNHGEKKLMKRAIIITTISLLVCSHSALAERSLAFIGGGGEPENLNTTIFDETLNSLDKYLQKNRWKSTISFNGAHSQTEAIMTMKFPDALSKNNFTPNNYNAIIKNYENQIATGQLKAGDQLMVIIDSHGAMKTNRESTHQIAVGAQTRQTSLNDLSGAKTISLDSLSNLSKLANSKGVKLAIIDFSCHSGNSLSLANEKTCVISSTGTNHFGYNTFSEAFIEKMKEGKSLEEVFLNTRKEITDNSFPMISTPEGLAINKDFYPVITPYLYYYDKNPLHDKMSDYLQETTNQEGLCRRNNQFNELLQQLESLKAISILNMTNNIPDVSRIKSLIVDYKAKQDRYINVLRSWGVLELERKETLIGIAKDGKKEEKMKGTYSWKEILESNFEVALKNIKSARATSKDAAYSLMLDASIDMHSKALTKQKEIIAQYPNLKEYKNKFNDKLTEMESSYDVANQIAKEERKLYGIMYSNLKSQKKESSPCKDFIL